MKNSIANVWLLGIIITFILLFAAYIAITVNYSTSFRMKNEIIDIIEKHKGMTNNPGTGGFNGVVSGNNNLVGNVGTLQTINLYLLGNAYQAKGYCPHDEYKYGVRELKFDSSLSFGGDIAELTTATDSEKFYYCFTANKTAFSGPYDSMFYTVRLFYKFEVPILSDILQVKVEGVTNEIYKPNLNDCIVDRVGYDSLPAVVFRP